MFIRRTQTRNRVSGEPYTTYRLVQTARVGGAVKQTTLLVDAPNERGPFKRRQIEVAAQVELIGYDFEAMDLNRRYRASDALYKHREALQNQLFAQAQTLFGFGQTITRYDLTNTYFEGTRFAVTPRPRCYGLKSPANTHRGPTACPGSRALNSKNGARCPQRAQLGSASGGPTPTPSVGDTSLTPCTFASLLRTLAGARP